MAAADQAVRAARRAAGPAQLRLGLIVGTQIQVTSTVLYAFRTAHPEVTLEWIVAETDDEVCRGWWLAAAHRTTPARLGQRTRSIDKFIQLVAARQVVGLAAALVGPVFARPGIAFVPVHDIEPATTAVAWHPERAGPLVEEFVALARRVRFAVGLAARLAGRA